MASESRPRRIAQIPSRWLTALGVALALQAGPARAQEGAFPESVEYRGQALGPKGQPLEGRFEVEARVFDRSGKNELWGERFAGVEVRGGQFALELGRGLAEESVRRYTSLRALFAANYQVEIEFSFDGQRYGPRVGLLPAGHSLESRMIIDGLRQPNDGRQHWRWYSHATDVSSFQATVLRPAAAGQRRGEGSASRSGPFLLPMEGPWISRPVSELPLASEQPEKLGEGEAAGDDEERVREGGEKGVSEINPPRHETLADAKGRPFGTVGSKAPDSLVELSRRGAVHGLGTPALTTSFEGINNISGFYPPDTEMAVGPNHIVQVTNVSFAVYSKTGSLLAGPVLTNTLWSSLPAGDVCRTNNDGDAIFMYDRQADRFVLTQFAVPNTGQKVCFAVSTTNNPTGTYYLYTFLTQRFPDYFKLGVWPDPANNAYFMGTNSGNQGEYDVYAIDRANLLSGTAPRTAQFFQSFPNLLMPADTDSATPPPAGSPGIFYSFRDGGEPYFGSPATDSLDLREFHVDWTTPANSTFNLVQSLTPAQGLAPFNWTICGFFASNCLPQPGTAVKIDSASWWPMQRLVYRNFGGRQTLVGSWTVDTLASGDHAAPRWFELRRGSQTSGNWTIYQQGTQSPDLVHRWMPSIAMDQGGNLALGYSVVDAGSTLYPSIRYATRTVNDDLGTMQAEANMQTGTGAQTGSAGRWGDYSSMEIDPVDDCTFWYTTEYLTTTGGAPWRTRVASFKLPECGLPNFSLDVAQTSATACSPGSASYPIEGWYYSGLTGNVTLSASGNPAGTSTSFTTNPLTAGSLTSTLTINGITAADAGVHTITLTGTGGGGSIVHSRTVTLAVDAPAAAPTLLSPANGATSIVPPPTLQWASVPGATSYVVEVDDNADFSSITFTTTVNGTTATATGLAASTTYHWRVRPANLCGNGSTSAVFSFTTGNCASPSLGIPDGNTTGVDSDIVIPAGGSLADLNLAITATHAYVGDTVFRLTHVDTGTSVVVIDRPGYTGTGFGCDKANIAVTLDDEGTDGPVEAQCSATPPALFGKPTPNNPLSAFDGESFAGTWRLNASDRATPDAGILQSWCLLPTMQYVSATPASQAVCAGTNAAYTVSLSSTWTNPSVTLSASGNPAGTTAGFSPNPVTPLPGTSTLTIGNTGAATPGSSTITITGMDGVDTRSAMVGLDILGGTPGAPTLTAPANGATAVPTLPTLTWTAAAGASSYLVEVDDNADFSSPVYSNTVAGTSTVAPGLASSTLYNWRVRPSNTCGAGTLSATFTFTTGTSFSEIEPNETKAQADANGIVGLPATSTGGVITGTTTGSVTTPGATSRDHFRVRTAAQATPGFYRHRLIITTAGTAGHTGTLRGLNQSAGVIGTTDSAIQSSVATTTPARFVQWYTTEAPADIYFSVAGTAGTTSPYSVDYEVSGPVTVTAGPTNVAAGSVTITTVGQTTVDTDLWLYDGSRAPIVGAGNDDEPSPGTTLQSKLTRTLAAGTYTLGISSFQQGNNLASAADDRFRSGTVADFPGVVFASSTTLNQVLNPMIAGTPVASTKAGAFDVNFISFTIPGPPTVASPTSSSITSTGATLGGDVTSDGGSAITERGVVYSQTGVNNDPAMGGMGVLQATAPGTTGTFTVPVTGLAQYTGYSFKAYATNALGTTYTSPASTFTTLADLPTVTSPTVTSITSTGATLGGNVPSDGGAPITEQGVVYSPTGTNSDPTIGGMGVTKVVASAGEPFTVAVGGLSPGTSYSFKAYATNVAGTSYTSPASTFSTLANAPTVTSPTAASITATSAVLGGNVTSNGGSPITGRGVVYSKTSVNSDPTIGGAGVLQAPASAATGVFTVPVSGLSSSTGYSFKAYATNVVGITYTSPASTFTTTSSTTITITKPVAAGLVWRAGTVQGLQWSHNLGSGSLVNVELSRDNGGSWTPIATNVVNAATLGTYNWTVTAPITTQARFRVSWASNPLVQSTNPQPVTITSRVQVTAPNTVSSLSVGQVLGIKWTHNYYGPGQTFRIDLDRDGNGSCEEPIATGVLTTTANGLYNWTITAPPSPAAKICVTSEADALGTDISDAPFSISRVNVTAPNTTSRTIGTAVTITWTHSYGAGHLFDIGIDRNGDRVCEETITTGKLGTATGGSYAWTVAGPASASNWICVKEQGDPVGDLNTTAFPIVP